MTDSQNLYSPLPLRKKPDIIRLLPPILSNFIITSSVAFSSSATRTWLCSPEMSLRKAFCHPPQPITTWGSIKGHNLRLWEAHTWRGAHFKPSIWRIKAAVWLWSSVAAPWTSPSTSALPFIWAGHQTQFVPPLQSGVWGHLLVCGGSPGSQPFWSLLKRRSAWNWWHRLVFVSKCLSLC